MNGRNYNSTACQLTQLKFFPYSYRSAATYTCIISYFYKFIAIAFDHKQSYWSNQHKQIYMYIYWFIVYLGIGVLDPWLLNNLIEFTSFKSCAPYLEASFWSRSTSCPNDIDQANIIGGWGWWWWWWWGRIFLIFYFKYNWWYIHVS